MRFVHLSLLVSAYLLVSTTLSEENHVRTDLEKCLERLNAAEFNDAIKKKIRKDYGHESAEYLLCGAKMLNDKYGFLRISIPTVQLATYFVFEERSGKKYLVGSFVANSHGAEQIRTLKTNRGFFIGVPENSHGTGCNDNSEKWVIADQRGLKEVLEIPIQGHRAGWGLSYDAEYKCSELVVGSTTSKKELFLEQDTLVTYFASRIDSCEEDHADKRVFLFSKKLRAIYEWNGWKRKWILSRTSELKGENSYDALGVWDSDADFLKRHHGELLEIAKTGNSSQKKWLDCFSRLKGVKNWKTEKRLEEITTALIEKGD